MFEQKKGEAVPELAYTGKEKGNNVTLTDRGNASRYTLARLKRDNPVLAERVIADEVGLSQPVVSRILCKKPVRTQKNA